MPDPFLGLRRFDGPVDPRPEFTDELRGRLAVLRSHPVITSASASPYLMVDDARRALDFYGAAFGATPTVAPVVMDDGRIGHVEFEIGGERFLMADEFPELGLRGPKALGGSPVSIHLEIADVDRATEAAVAAGATLERAPEDQFHGNRNAVVVDPFGHRWMLSAPLR